MAVKLVDSLLVYRFSVSASLSGISSKQMLRNPVLPPLARFLLISRPWQLLTTAFSTSVAFGDPTWSFAGKLYVEGLIGGKIANNDTGFDIDEIEASYMRQQGKPFWVAVEHEGGAAIGMIGVQSNETGTAEIRRLRVRPDRRRKGVGSKLLETALGFCQRKNYLKVTLDTFVDRDPAIKLFEKFDFRHEKTRTIDGKNLMYFYLDLYSGEKKEA